MIYTVGHTESYAKGFKEAIQTGIPLQKKGRDECYVGGSVWESREEAAAHCPKDYTVYGVIADFATDTAASNEGQWHDLLIDANLVELS